MSILPLANLFGQTIQRIGTRHYSSEQGDYFYWYLSNGICLGICAPASFACPQGTEQYFDPLWPDFENFAEDDTPSRQPPTPQGLSLSALLGGVIQGAGTWYEPDGQPCVSFLIQTTSGQELEVGGMMAGMTADGYQGVGADFDQFRADQAGQGGNPAPPGRAVAPQVVQKRCKYCEFLMAAEKARC